MFSPTTVEPHCGFSVHPCPLYVQPLSSPLLFIHLVPEAHRVDHSEAQAHVALLQVVGLSPQLHLRLKVGGLKVLKVCVEQSVH